MILIKEYSRLDYQELIYTKERKVENLCTSDVRVN